MAQTLLLIDDDELTRVMVGMLLETDGWRVISAACGEDAVVAAEEQGGAIDAVLSDLQMPGLAGKELAEALRAKLRGVRLLAMTATVRDAADLQGFDRLLQKPVDARAVRGALVDCSVSASGDCVGHPPGGEPHADVVAGTGKQVSSPHHSQKGADGSGRNDGGVEDRKERDGSGWNDGRVGEAAADLDEGTWEKMSLSMGPAQLKGLFVFALEDAERRVVLMRRACEAQDNAELRREAHALKGSAGMIGAVRLQGLCAELERGGLLVDTSAALDEIVMAIARLRSMLAERAGL